MMIMDYKNIIYYRLQLGILFQCKMWGKMPKLGKSECLTGGRKSVRFIFFVAYLQMQICLVHGSRIFGEISIIISFCFSEGECI